MLPNATISNGTLRHVSQIFFDQTLLQEVEATHPYDTNTQELTRNEEDYILGEETSVPGANPFLQYVYINGHDISAGVFGWVTIGLNTSVIHTTGAAGHYYEEGVVPLPKQPLEDVLYADHQG